MEDNLPIYSFKIHIFLDSIFPLPGIYYVHKFGCVHKGISPRMSTAAVFVFKELEWPSVEVRFNVLLNPCNDSPYSHSKELSSSSIDIKKASIILTER